MAITSGTIRMLDGQQDLYLCPAAWNTPPVIYTHTHTPRAYPALKRGARKHGHWGGRGAWRCWPDAGHKKLLMPGTPCVPLGMAGAPSPGDRVGTTAWVPPQWLPRQRRDVRQDSFLITAMAQVSITFRRRLE